MSPLLGRTAPSARLPFCTPRTMLLSLRRGNLGWLLPRTCKPTKVQHRPAAQASQRFGDPAEGHCGNGWNITWVGLGGLAGGVLLHQFDMDLVGFEGGVNF